MKNESESLIDGAVRAITDTTVLIYAYSPAEPTKQERAEALIETLLVEKRLVLSTQVLNEFYNVATRAHKPPSLSHDDAVRALRRFEALCEVVPLTAAVTFRALDAVARYRFHFWDALIWAAAKENGVGIIYTEDVPSADVIEGVRYVNPFASKV